MKAISMINAIFALFNIVSAQNINSKAYVSRCNNDNDNIQCQFDSSSLQLSPNNTIEIVFNATSPVVRCKNTAVRGSYWYGVCEGDADDANFVRRPDKNGIVRLYGSIQIAGNICQIAPTLNGTDEINCRPRTDFMDEDVALSPSVLSGQKELRNLKFGYTPSLTGLRGNNRLEKERKLFDDSGANIDVLVVWTKEAECRNSGLAIGCNLTATTEEKMRGLIDLAVSETNTAYVMSGIYTTLRLVHAYRDPDYIEAATYATTLEQLTFTTDGSLDDVHKKRALYGADVVHMIAGAPGSCGIAWSGAPKKTTVFSISHFSCATGYYSFGHEIAHGFNMLHDRGTENICQTNSTFNYAYRDRDSEFRTILAYDCKIGDCDNLPTAGCVRVQRFSNSDPSFTYNGKPIGNAQNDNARQFNSVKGLVATFFPAMNCKSNTECNDGDSTTVDTCNIAKGVCIFAAPIVAPAPVQTGAQAFMESLKVNANSTAWAVVPLTRKYISPIPVCSVKYDIGITLLPAVVRIQAVTNSSFQVRLQNPSNAVIASRVVSCLVVEAGAWKLPDGRFIEAQKYSSTVTDNTKSWVGQTQVYRNKYKNPAVLGQVMSFNNVAWSTFWSRSRLSKNNSPTPTEIVTGKHVGEDPKSTRIAETVGFIVIDAGHSNSTTTIEFEAGRGPDAFTAYTGKKFSAAFTKAFPVAPAVTVVCQMAMDDVDGSWAVTTTDASTSGVGISIDEDDLFDTERAHTNEEIAYAAFAVSGAIPLTKV